MKSIIFNTEEVKAILDSRKSQFRKVITNKQLEEIYKNDCYIQDGKIFEHCMGQGDPDGNGGIEIDHWEEDITSLSSKYKVDDIIYVKETFYRWENMRQGYMITYKADKNLHGIKWKPSIRLKERDARIFLKVTNVRVEKLQNISEEDSLAEGIEYVKTFYRIKKGSQLHNHWDYAVEELWNKKAKDGYKWEDNPYVFVCEFERVEK